MKIHCLILHTHTSTYKTCHEQNKMSTPLLFFTLKLPQRRSHKKKKKKHSNSQDSAQPLTLCQQLLVTSEETTNKHILAALT